MSAAAEKLEHRRRGWTTEEDKKMKIFNLPKVNKAFWNSFESFEHSYDFGLLCYQIEDPYCGFDREMDERCKDCRLVLKLSSEKHDMT